MAEYPNIRMLIDGEWCDAGDGETGPIINPATEEELGRYPFASTDQLDRAITAAERAFPVWRDTAPAERARILKSAARLLRERSARVGEIMTLEEGKPLKEATGEAQRVAGTLEWDAEEGRRTYGRIIPSDKDTLLTVTKQPIGPVAAFVPWNFPAGSPMRKLAGALSAGCSIVLKASEETPGTACAIVECLVDAGVPAGVINLVYGDPATISEHVIAAPEIRLVAFTGSIPVGKLLAAQAAKFMKPTLMELGGHAPVVVCADADPVKAARASAFSKFLNAGQVCTSPSRFIVHSSLYEEFVAALTAAAEAVKVGNGLEDGVQMGPLANDRRLAAVEALVADAIGGGAKLTCGGKRLGDRGYFYAPTVLRDVPLDCRIMNEEPFGPLAPVVAFDELDEALSLANKLPYGLAAFGFTESAATAQELAQRLEAGVLSINHTGGSVSEAPTGGVKESGHGREGGAEALEAYLVTKRISHRLR